MPASGWTLVRGNGASDKGYISDIMGANETEKATSGDRL